MQHMLLSGITKQHQKPQHSIIKNGIHNYLCWIMQRDNIIHNNSRAQSTFTVHEGGIHHMTIGREVGIKANQY